MGGGAGWDPPPRSAPGSLADLEPSDSLSLLSHLPPQVAPALQSSYTRDVAALITR